MNRTIETGNIELGHLVGELGWNKPRAKFLLILWGLLLPFSLLPAMLIIGIPFLLAHLWFLARCIHRLNSSKVIVRLYQYGFVDTRRGEPKIVRYADIAKFYLAADRVTFGQVFYTYTLHMRDGERIKLGIEIANPKQLGAAIREGMVVAQFPQHLTDLKAGKSIAFDRLSLSAQGLSLKKKQLAWQDLDRSEIVTVRGYKNSSSVHLDIYQKGQENFWARFQRDRFPNLSLFFALCEYMQKTVT